MVALYFAFTSLSTVGFGDFYPISNLERMVSVVMLCFGVVIFTAIMDNFTSMIIKIREFYEGFDEDPPSKGQH